MKKYIFSLVCLCCALLPALEGQAALHEHPEYPELRKSDANIVGHILDKNTKEHLPYITIALKGTTIGTCNRRNRTLFPEEPSRRKFRT